MLHATSASEISTTILNLALTRGKVVHKPWWASYIEPRGGSRGRGSQESRSCHCSARPTLLHTGL